jgi:hypothetical protein
MSKIYDQHSQAFRYVEAYAVLKDGELVARITFKFARSGLQTQCYVHWIGIQMVKGRANGGGYDKSSAAAAHAANKMPLGLDAKTGTECDPNHDYNPFLRALRKDDGYSWDRCLRDAGFNVVQAV